MPNLVSTEVAGRLIYAILTSFPELSVLTSNELGMRMAVSIMKEFSEKDAPKKEVLALVQEAVAKASSEAAKLEASTNKNTGPQWLGEQNGVLN